MYAIRSYYVPGEDHDLALGFCFTEGLICGAADVEDISHCTEGLGESYNFV